MWNSKNAKDYDMFDTARVYKRYINSLTTWCGVDTAVACGLAGLACAGICRVCGGVAGETQVTSMRWAQTTVSLLF